MCLVNLKFIFILIWKIDKWSRYIYKFKKNNLKEDLICICLDDK